MSEIQFAQTVAQEQIQQEIERVIVAAQSQPITQDDASLLRWATGTSTKGNKYEMV